jgi:protein SCO1
VIVDASYRLGLSVVYGTVALAAAVCLAFVNTHPEAKRAASDLADQPKTLGAFHLTERSGKAVTDADLADRVWIASFIFTRCPSSCPRISSLMKSLQGSLAGTGVRLVSLSVDPEHDTPAVLADFARKFGADGHRWWFLTGSKADVYNLILERFQLGVAESSSAEQQQGAEAVSHSARLALVDRGNRVVGYFDSDDAEQIRLLVAKARQLDGAWVRRFPELNAGLNASAGLLLVVGWTLIRSGRVRSHAICMSLAVAVSALFLGCYLVYHYHVGSVPFRGVGPIRIVYFTILLSHTVLAIAIVPLIATTLRRAIGRRFVEHARIARVTFPIWVYVSITGVLVYVMLYRLSVPTSLG